ILDLKGKLITGEDGELLSKRLCESISNGKSNLLLNLGKLTQVDSSGVSIIARTHGSLKRLGGNLGLLRPSGHVLAWIIHDFTGEKRKDALKGVMNTGFWRTRHSLSEHPRDDILLYTTAFFFLLPTPTH